MTMHRNRFADRRHAGRLLAAALESYAGRSDVIVLGLPRGGVPVAFEVARALHVPLDVIVVRKLGVPGWEELAMGAIATGGVRILNRDVISSSSISPEQIEEATARELSELRRREIAFRGSPGAPDITGKTVLLIDDGIATGATIQAAVRVLKAQKPAAIIVGVPVASDEAVGMLEPEVDAVTVLQTPSDFRAVGQFYDDFSQTTDADVRALLSEAHAQPLAGFPD
jgi:putative phosphoribosyl transferase